MTKKLTVETIEQIKSAIENARSVDEVARLERALDEQDVSKVMDLISGGAHELLDAWKVEPPSLKRKLDDTSNPPQAKQVKVDIATTNKSDLAPMTTTTSTAATKVTGTSTVALSLLIDRAKHDPSYQSSIAAPVSHSEGWRSSQECPALVAARR
jgi:hypothetical protein